MAEQKRMGPVAKLLCTIAMLVFGTFNTLNLRWEFMTCVPTLSTVKDLKAQSAADHCPEGMRFYNKPWMNNFFMFMGESALLPIYLYDRVKSDRKRMKVGKSPRPRDGTNSFLFSIPASCDVLGSGLGAVAMMYISASVWQMMRSAIIVFTAALTVIFLKKPLMCYHLFAILVTVCGLLTVGFAAVQEAGSEKTSNIRESPTGTYFGIGLVLAAQLTASFQCVFEEYLLKGMNVSAKKTVGMEGFWGCLVQGLMCIAFAYIPGSDEGVVQSMPDTVEQYTGPGSRALNLLTLSYMMSIAVYNLSGLKVTKSISAVTRCLIDSCRTLVVWSTSLALYYSGFTNYGSPWTVWSHVQLCGFALLVLGTLLYNAILRLPCFNYDYDSFEDPPMAIWSPRTNPAKGMDDFQLSPPMSPLAPHHATWDLREPLLPDLHVEDLVPNEHNNAQGYVDKTLTAVQSRQ